MEMDRAGRVRVVAPLRRVSGGLDEFDIARLVATGAPIDAYGVGTRMGVSSDAPSLDSAYKLVAYADRPVMKLSVGKETAPGPKQVYRYPDHRDDIIALRDEPPLEGARALLVPVMRGGRRTGAPERIAEMRERFVAATAALPEPARRVHDPIPPVATFSQAVQSTAARIREQHRH